MKKILFICGSLNQTTQMHQIARQLMDEHDCYFTPYYADGVENFAAKMGWLNFTVLGGRHLRETNEYLARHKLKVDLRGEANSYDLVVTCSDLIVQKNLRGKRVVLIQEGITEPEGLIYKLVKWFKLPRYLANTAANGLSDAYEVFCVASQGYAAHFIRKGVKREKIQVTGIPNFDDMESFRRNNFPFRDYVLVATTPLRETFRPDDRNAFIRRCMEIGTGRRLIFKLHPTENAERAAREIKQIVPTALVLTDGNLSHMIANARVVITQQSTSTFVAVALGREVHTSLNVEELKRLMPIQNGGTSAMQIARVCVRLLHAPAREAERIPAKARARALPEQP
jgi:galactitol-specific phosphotransferase system IIB component